MRDDIYLYGSIAESMNTKPKKKIILPIFGL